MAKKHKQLAAARARAARWKNQPLAAITCLAGACPPLPLSAYSADVPEALGTESSAIVELHLDCLSDCGYTEGINFYQSDDEYEPDSPSGSEWFDNKSLCELEGAKDQCRMEEGRTKPVSNHPQFLNQPKGIKTVLVARGLYQAELRGRCAKCDHDSRACSTNAFSRFSPTFSNRSHTFRKSSKCWPSLHFPSKVPL
jgi:hypothetical protein